MKLLMITSTLPRWKNDSESNWVLELAKHLNQDSIILAPFDGGSKEDEIMDEIKIKRFKYSLSKPVLCYGEGILPNFKRSFKAKLQALMFPFAEFFAMRKLIKKEKIDLILAWWIIPQGFLAAINKKLFGTEYICIAAGSDIFPLKNKLFRMMQEFSLKNAKKVIVTSSALKEEIQARFPDIKPIVIPVGVNDYFMPKPKEQSTRTKILCVGRLTPQKGFDVMLKALSLLDKAELTIVGEGGELDNLKQLAKDLKVENRVTFAGKRNNIDLIDFYHDADVFVLPSRGFEALGMVCAEAMASGTPVIASDLDGIKDIVIDGKTGMTFAQEDEEDLGDKILTVANGKNYIENGLAHINRNFTWESIAKKYERVIA